MTNISLGLRNEIMKMQITYLKAYSCVEDVFQTYALTYLCPFPFLFLSPFLSPFLSLFLFLFVSLFLLLHFLPSPSSPSLSFCNVNQSIGEKSLRHYFIATFAKKCVIQHNCNKAQLLFFLFLLLLLLFLFLFPFFLFLPGRRLITTFNWP